MGISEADLPGIGRRYEFDVVDRDRLVAIVHHGGQHDLYAFRPGAGNARGSAQLDAETARQLGAIIAGQYYRPRRVDPIASTIGRYEMTSAVVSEQSRIAGHSIMDLELRRRTGVTVLAILSGSATRIDPPPATVIAAGDTVVVVGQQAALDEFAAIAAGFGPEVTT